jgi:hypothetical protein
MAGSDRTQEILPEGSQPQKKSSLEELRRHHRFEPKGMRQKWALLLDSLDLAQAQNCQGDLTHAQRF